MERKQRLRRTLIFLLFITISVVFLLHLGQTNQQNYQNIPAAASNLITASDESLLHIGQTNQQHYQNIPAAASNLLTATDETLKPWPFLPSFLPWTPDPTPLSCESYFGHGFSRTIYLLGSEPVKTNQSFIKTHYSETLDSSIWEMGMVRMHPDRISMSEGGEELKSVIGRNEYDELPKYQEGAIEIEGELSKYVNGKIVDETFLNPAGEVHMRKLVDSIRVVEFGSLKCDQWIEEPTILVTRFEYANLFHTVTDWYSAYVASRVTNLPHRPHLVFVDGHCKTQLDETWKAIFSSVRYAKRFPRAVCFRHAILAPLGYDTPIFKALSSPISCQGTQATHQKQKHNSSKTSRMHEFGELITASLKLPVPPEKPARGHHNILFIRRENYLAHPRHSGRVESRLSNEQEVFEAIKGWSSTYMRCRLNVVNGLFAHMHMKDQVKAVREASVVVGAHGAGLTHLVHASPGTVVVEIIDVDLYLRSHFALISQWKGLEYHAVHVYGSRARPHLVVGELSRIVGGLPC